MPVMECEGPEEDPCQTFGVSGFEARAAFTLAPTQWPFWASPRWIGLRSACFTLERGLQESPSTG
jgi:hypothetical protein